jgi:hypothetical protein
MGIFHCHELFLSVLQLAEGLVDRQHRRADGIMDLSRDARQQAMNTNEKSM